MSNKNKLKKDFDAKVEDQKKEQTTPDTSDEKTEGTEDTQDTGEDKKDEKKFHFPKITLPKLHLPSKETVFAWLKGIFVFLLGTIAGAVGIVACAQKIVDAAKITDPDEEDDTTEEVEEEEIDEPEAEPEPDAAEETEA